jgi:hypothetical protein
MKISWGGELQKESRNQPAEEFIIETEPLSVPSMLRGETSTTSLSKSR